MELSALSKDKQQVSQISEPGTGRKQDQSKRMLDEEVIVTPF